MSQHPSLKIDSVGAKHRNVLKRFERVKTLKEQEKWQDRSSVYGLPKVKSQKIKVKKIKEEGPKAEGESAAGAAPAGAPAKDAGAKQEKGKK